MRVMNSYRLTLFLEDRTEMAGVVTEPAEESMEHAQASGSIPCGYVKEPRSAKNMMIDLVKMLRNVFLMQGTVLWSWTHSTFTAWCF